MKVIKQGWYKELGPKWHPEENFNMRGEFIAIVDLEDRSVEDIESVFTVRNFVTGCTIKMKNGNNFHFKVINDALYLDVSYDKITDKLIRIKIDLSWYTLGYSYKLIGSKHNKKYFYDEKEN